MRELGARDLDLIVLGGTRILRGPILGLPRDGVVNSHPGWLPDCRGSASVAWSVLHDIPIGASTHFCDAGVDTGDLLLRRRVDVRRGATYEDLCYGTLVLAGVLMQEALTAYVDGRWPELRTPQGPSAWPTFRNAPEEVLAAVRGKLAAGTYAHFAGNAPATVDPAGAATGGLPGARGGAGFRRADPSELDRAATDPLREGIRAARELGAGRVKIMAGRGPPCCAGRWLSRRTRIDLEI